MTAIIGIVPSGTLIFSDSKATQFFKFNKELYPRYLTFSAGNYTPAEKIKLSQTLSVMGQLFNYNNLKHLKEHIGLKYKLNRYALVFI